MTTDKFLSVSGTKSNVTVAIELQMSEFSEATCRVGVDGETEFCLSFLSSSLRKSLSAVSWRLEYS